MKAPGPTRRGACVQLRASVVRLEHRGDGAGWSSGMRDAHTTYTVHCAGTSMPPVLSLEVWLLATMLMWT